LQAFAIKIDITPVEREQFALSQAAGESQNVQRLQPITVGCSEEPSGLFRAERGHLVARNTRRIDQISDVARDQAPPARLLKSPSQHHMGVPHRRRTAACFEPVRVELTKMLRRKPVDPDAAELRKCPNPYVLAVANKCPRT
jgi:hypothetical protein